MFYHGLLDILAFIEFQTSTFGQIRHIECWRDMEFKMLLGDTEKCTLSPVPLPNSKLFKETSILAKNGWKTNGC